MSLKINSWFGRLGNNLIQLRNIISIAIYYDYNIILPPHRFLKKTEIIINKNQNNQIYIDKEGTNFFYSSKIKKFDKKCFTSNIQKMKEILKQLFILDISKLTPLKDNELVIHIRGGDIFSNHPHPGYIPPPLSYYTNIIDNGNYEKIYLINDVNNNPCIPLLKQKYNNIIHNKNNLINDIIYILSAKNIIFTVGTFPCSLLFLTNHIQNIYYPSYSIQVKEILHYFNDINFYPIELKNYRETIGKWTNSKKQNLLLT
jgi:hypothetical protein